MELKQKRSYRGVDLAKIFFAFCIIALHADAVRFLPGVWVEIIEKGIFRLAVPYFFVASGFFLYQKVSADPAQSAGPVIKGYCLRLLRPLIVFELINIAQEVISLLRAGVGISGIVLNIGRSVLFYPHGALWFVQACIIGAILLVPFVKKKRIKLAAVIGAALFCVALICNNYYFLVKGTPLQPVIELYLKLCVSPRNGLFVGFFYLAVGMLCGRVSKWAVAHRTATGVVCLGLYLLYFVEILVLYYLDLPAKDDGSLYISHVALVPTLLLVTLTMDPPVPQETSVLLRNLSTGMYYLHRPVLWFVALVSSVGILNFAIVAAACVLICILTYRSQNKFLCGLLK